MWKLQRLAYLHLCGFIAVVDEKSFEDSKRKFMGGGLARGRCVGGPHPRHETRSCIQTSKENRSTCRQTVLRPLMARSQRLRRPISSSNVKCWSAKSLRYIHRPASPIHTAACSCRRSTCETDRFTEPRTRSAKHQQIEPLPRRSYASWYRVRTRRIAMESLRERYGQESE